MRLIRFFDIGVGSGRRYDYRVSVIIVKEYLIVLVGGLILENVGEVIRWVKLVGVDVLSGVERNGVKDRVLIEVFMVVVRNG